ncbi:MAG: PAS domain-containing sensor histidine kinase [Candidatus Obscuribacterales bacterium]|nr:PAS domain-containing sensor histidine kinase [Candidatus Obscuribacterales bacterium]
MPSTAIKRRKLSDRLDRVSIGVCVAVILVNMIILLAVGATMSRSIMDPSLQTKLNQILTVWFIANLTVPVAIHFAFTTFVVRRLDAFRRSISAISQGESVDSSLAANEEISLVSGLVEGLSKQLTESIAREKAIADYALDLICAIDRQGNFQAISPVSRRMWGYAPWELVRRHISMVLPDEEVEHVEKLLTGARSSTGGVSFETKIRCRDGSIMDMLWSIEWSTTEEAVFCVAQDITLRKQAEDKLKASEARMRAIVDNMPVGIFSVTKDGIIESANPSAETMMQRPTTELQGLNIKDLFTRAMEPMEGDFMQQLSQKTAGRAFRLEVDRQDGTSFGAEMAMSDYQGLEGLRYLIVVEDVTERLEVERLKNEFLAMVSHDLRTPLTSVQAFFHMLTAGVYGQFTEQGIKKLGAAERNVERLLRLVNDLLDIEKLESGAVELTPDSVELASVLERSVEAVRSFAESGSVMLENNSPPLKVHVDAERIVQVLVNLLSNAIKYSPAGGKVTVGVEDSKNGFVTVKVTDEGPGIPEVHRKSIFERFKQIKDTDAVYKKGSGLGLAIAQQIVRVHGGEIGVDSEEGKGSSFWFTLPRG